MKPTAKKAGARVKWTAEQDEHLRRVWASTETVRENMDGFGAHTWAAVIRRASTLNLGKRPTCPRIASVAPALVLRELESGPKDRFELAAAVNMTAGGIHKQLMRMKEEGQIHVGGWQRRVKSKIPVPLFAAGPGKDVPKPERATNAVRQRQIRERARVARSNQANPVKRFNPFANLVHQVAA